MALHSQYAPNLGWYLCQEVAIHYATLPEELNTFSLKSLSLRQFCFVSILHLVSFGGNPYIWIWQQKNLLTMRFYHKFTWKFSWKITQFFSLTSDSPWSPQHIGNEVAILRLWKKQNTSREGKSKRSKSCVITHPKSMLGCPGQEVMGLMGENNPVQVIQSDLFIP